MRKWLQSIKWDNHGKLLNEGRVIAFWSAEITSSSEWVQDFELTDG